VLVRARAHDAHLGMRVRASAGFTPSLGNRRPSAGPSGTIAEREAAHAARKRAEAAARREVAAESGADQRGAAPARLESVAVDGRLARTSGEPGPGWARAERSALASLEREGEPAAVRPLDGGAYDGAGAARRERRTAGGSTKRDAPDATGRSWASHTSWRAPKGEPWASALVVFAGRGGDLDLPARLRARGLSVTAVDTKQGGARHDVLRAEVGDRGHKRDVAARNDSANH